MPDDTNPGFNNAEQPKPITGYRKLTDAEIDLMNEIKAHEAKTALLLARIRAQIGGKPSSPDAQRQASIARTEFEGAFMRLARAVAQPVTPWENS